MTSSPPVRRARLDIRSQVLLDQGEHGGVKDAQTTLRQLSCLQPAFLYPAVNGPAADVEQGGRFIHAQQTLVDGRPSSGSARAVDRKWSVMLRGDEWSRGLARTGRHRGGRPLPCDNPARDLLSLPMISRVREGLGIAHTVEPTIGHEAALATDKGFINRDWSRHRIAGI